VILLVNIDCDIDSDIVIEILIDSDIVNQEMNYTPKHIYELVFRNNIVNLKVALSEGNNSKDGYRCDCGMMAIHTAAARSKDCLSILLESGFDIEGRTAHNSTPLIISCCNKRRDCAELLLQHGAQIESKDE